ncbi:MAG: GNAT family N-acetyltransferase [Chthonomonadales bacterium]
MNQPLHIVELTPDDAAPLLSFYHSLSPAVTEVFLPFDAVSWDTLEAHLAEAARGIHLSLALVTDTGEIVGHGFIANIRSMAPTLGIGLRDDYIGRGYGRMLMEQLLALADADNLPLVTLTVVKSNERALRLYLRCGFRITGEATFRAPNDSWYMERRAEQNQPP